MTEEVAPAEDGRLSDLALDLDVLSNEQRLGLLHELTTPQYAEEIADGLGMSRQAAAKHIERLQERGFIRALNGRRARGPVVEYQVVPQKLFALGLALQELARLETKGGPLVRRVDPTVEAPAEGRIEPTPRNPEALPTTAYLLVASSPMAGERFALLPSERAWSIGRDEDRALRLVRDPFVSARHAEVRRGADGGFDLIDHFSSNGTFVNFVRIPRGGRVRLAPGDLLTIGRTLLAFQAPT